MRVSNRTRTLAAVAGGIAASGVAVAAIGLVSGVALSVYFARKIVTPPGRADSALRVLAVGESTIVLTSSWRPGGSAYGSRTSLGLLG